MATYSSSEQTRRALIQAAGELAAEMGFGNVTTRAIARRAQENVGSIHYHFGGKDRLFQEVLMEATHKMREIPMAQIFAELEPQLDTPKGKARAIRAVVRKKMQILFDEEVPEWHCQVIYQALRKKCALRDFLKDEVLAPSVRVEEELFRRIAPELSMEDCFLHSFLMGTPIYFHADYMEVILEHLEMDRYSGEYLRKLENAIVRQTQLYFGLPDDREPERGDMA